MKKCFLNCAGILLVSGMCMAQSDSPSLAEVARQNKAEKKAVKVLTDEDLPARSSSSYANTTDTSSASRDGKGQTQDATAADKKEQDKNAGLQSKDKPGVAELKKKLESYQAEKDTWKTSLQRYQTLLENETNDFRRQTYQNAIDNDKSNIALYQQKIDQIQGELSNAQKAPSSAHSGSK
jgi:hypothetical protein